MGGCISVNRTDSETINGSSTNVSRPASGKFIFNQFFSSFADFLDWLGKKVAWQSKSISFGASTSLTGGSFAQIPF